MAKPSVGRIVHYSEHGKCQAAIIASVVKDDQVHLATFEQYGTSFGRPHVPYSETKENNTWHWPERVEE